MGNRPDQRREVEESIRHKWVKWYDQISLFTDKEGSAGYRKFDSRGTGERARKRDNKKKKCEDYAKGGTGLSAYHLD